LFFLLNLIVVLEAFGLNLVGPSSSSLSESEPELFEESESESEPDFELLSESESDLSELLSSSSLLLSFKII